MFEALNQVREKWDNSEVVLVYDDLLKSKRLYLALPAQHIMVHHIQLMKKHGRGPFRVVFDEHFGHVLDLPFLNVIYKGISSRYHVVSMIEENNSDRNLNSSESFSVSHTNTKNETSNESLALTISELGNLVDDYENSSKDAVQLMNSFTKNFKLPGSVVLHRCDIGGFKSRVSICEVGIALCQITNQTSAGVLIEYNSANGTNEFELNEAEILAKKINLQLIGAKNIFDLWRSIKRVPKNKIADIRFD
jgi:3,4-dihydroxy-2-butanone 4-phosphate synthase